MSAAFFPLVVMALVAVLDVLVGPRLLLLPLLSLGPALAPAFLGPTGTILTGAGAIGLGVLDPFAEGQLGSSESMIAYGAIAGVTVAGIAASAVRQRRERELIGVRAVADVMRRVFLRPVPAEAGQLRLGVRYVAADAAAGIGGDLYDVVTTPGTLRLIVGDVQGKGLGAVHTAAVVLGAFRESAHDAGSLAEIADQLELSLARQAGGEFVTAVMTEIAEDGEEAFILNCGHPAPLLLHGAGASLAEPPEADLPLGLAELIDARRKHYTVPFGPGDQLLFYTDGISEARDEQGGFYPLQLRGPLLAGLDPGPALDRLYSDIMRHAGHNINDDCVALIVCHSAARPPGTGTGGQSTDPGAFE
jgi:serine phosphatase RsbU (regulator of sigma subunit)